MNRLFAVFMAVFFLSPGLTQAQSPDDVVWIQIEAQPNLADATERARAYADSLEDVNGFSLGSGWYGIAVGPYIRQDAELLLRNYRRIGAVPRDSFVQMPERFQQQFWPVGVNLLETQAIDAALVDAPPVTTQTEGAGDITQSTLPPAGAAGEDAAATDTPQTELLAVTPQAPAPPVDETLAEARRSERDLNREDRERLQIALQWAGYYAGRIDGAFGRGTRGSMGDWQDANGYDRTGVLTTLQRAALLKQYNAVLEGLGLEMVRDAQAGIEMIMPTEIVAFEKYEPPFAHYSASGDLNARVLLISQAGDQDTLFGLYDIMQTLEIVPAKGPRERRNDRFELIGENGRIISQTQAYLKDGQIKGFTLIWPAGDEDRRRRVIAEMTKSFTRLPGVLDAAAGGGDDQAIDLISGLEVRKPKISRSGFFVDAAGTIATTTETLQSCGRIALDDETELEVIVNDIASGVALLKPRTRLAPFEVASFNPVSPRLQSEIAVGGFPYEGVLGAATVTFGALADVRGLNGEQDITRLVLASQPGDAGGPIFDQAGRVLGMLLPRKEGDQQFPEDVNFALEAKAIADIAQRAGVSVNTSSPTSTTGPQDLRETAKGMTVLVSCWE